MAKCNHTENFVAQGTIDRDNQAADQQRIRIEAKVSVPGGPDLHLSTQGRAKLEPGSTRSGKKFVLELNGHLNHSNMDGTEIDEIEVDEFHTAEKPRPQRFAATDDFGTEVNSDDEAGESDVEIPISATAASAAIQPAQLPIGAIRPGTPPAVPRTIRFAGNIAAPTAKPNRSVTMRELAYKTATEKAGVTSKLRSTFKTTKSNNGRRKSTAQRAQLLLPPSRARRVLDAKNLRISKTAPITMSAIAEYLVAELLDGATQATLADKRKIVKPKDIYAALQNDEELREFVGKVVIPGADHKLQQRNSTIVDVQ